MTDKKTFKPGRIEGKNAAHRSENLVLPKRMNKAIEDVLQANKDKAALKDKKVGQETQDKRRTVIRGFFGELWKLGYKLESISNLKEKHLKAVFALLEEGGQSTSTLQNKISIMRTFCGWIGKNGMVRDSSLYVTDVKSVERTVVAQEDKSWVGNGIDVLAKIQEIAEKDKHVALWLELSLAFGLRAQEAIKSRPCVLDGGSYIWVHEGTKGGRARVVPVENAVQRDVLIRAQAVADGRTGFLGERGKTYAQKRDRFYYVLKCIGITLNKEGVTAHGLRHQYMHESFKRVVGIEAPIRGGDLSQVGKGELHVASQKLMERAGHTRVTIGAAYYGSRRVKKLVAAIEIEKAEAAETEET